MSSTDRTLATYRRCLETAVDLFGTILPGDPYDVFQDLDGSQIYPPVGIPPYYQNSKSRGEVLPVYTNWQQLKYIRDRSRRLCVENEFAICATENRRNYVVGDGFSYRATGDEDLAKQVQQVLDAWAAAVEVAEYEHDSMERLDKDGEFFLRFFKRENGLLEMRFVEPEHVRNHEGDQWSPAVSFGVITEPDDVETVVGYSVVEQPWLNEDTAFVPAEEMTHVKLNVPRNAKRGLPTFYPVESNLRRAEDLLASMTHTAKARAKIALVRHVQNVTSTAAQNLVNTIAAAKVTDPATQQQLTVEKLHYGTILNAPGNVEYDMPFGRVDAGSFVGVLQAELRAVAARLNMPEWMLTVDASNTNYASAFVAESQAVKSFRRLQRMLCRRFGESRHPRRKSVAWRQVEYAVELGVLPRECLTQVEIQCEGPSLETRDKAQEAQVNKLYLDLGIKSPQTIAQEQGLDYDQERGNLAKLSGAVAQNGPVATAAESVAEELADDTAVSGPPRPGQHGHEPAEQPDLNEFVLNKFAGLYPPRDADADDLHPESGFLLHNGRAVQMGPADTRLNDHREAIPTRDAMRRWGWPEGVIQQVDEGSRLPALYEMMRRNGMARFVGSKTFGHSVEHVQPLTRRQKQAILQYAERYKPDEFGFTRVTPNVGEDEKNKIFSPHRYAHKFVPGDQLEDYLFGGLREELDDLNDAHDDYGGYVQKRFNTPGAEKNPDPLGRQDEVRRRAYALKLDHVSAQLDAEDRRAELDAAIAGGAEPDQLDKLLDGYKKSRAAANKALQAASSAERELTAVASGPVQPDADELDRLLTGGPVGFISAGRNSNNPEHADLDDAEFDKRHEALGQDLTKSGYKYAPIVGRYGGSDEKSYLVQVPREKLHELTALGRKYGQESILHSEKGQNQLIYATGPNAGKAHRGTGFSYQPDAEDMFSQYTDPQGRPVKFSMNLDFNGLHPVQESVYESVGYTPDDADDDAPTSPELKKTADTAVRKYGHRLRDLLLDTVPSDERFGKVPPPESVVAFNKALDAELQKLPESYAAPLDKVLSDFRHPLHAFVGELEMAARHGKPHLGHGNVEDAAGRLGTQRLWLDNRMTAAPTDPPRKFNKQAWWYAGRASQQHDQNALTINHALNPGRNGGPGMVVYGAGLQPLTTEDTPGRKVADTDRVKVAARFKSLPEWLYTPKAIAAEQKKLHGFLKGLDVPGIIENDFAAHVGGKYRRLSKETLLRHKQEVEAALAAFQ